MAPSSGHDMQAHGKTSATYDRALIYRTLVLPLWTLQRCDRTESTMQVFSERAQSATTRTGPMGLNECVCVDAGTAGFAIHQRHPKLSKITGVR